MDETPLRRLSSEFLMSETIVDDNTFRHFSTSSSKNASSTTATEDVGVSEDPESCKERPGKATSSRRSYYFTVGSILLTVLPFVFLGVWQIYTGPLTLSTHLTPHTIGGRFTQSQAKVIDFICSALLGPLLLVSLNWYWFSITKVTVVSDGSTDATPLLALVQASYTESGSYNPVRLFTFIRTGRVKMLLFGLLVLLSAIAQTCLNNFIAYEAYDVATATPTQVPLRSLLTGLEDVFDSPRPGLQTDLPPGYDFSSTQVAKYVGDATSLLSNIAYENATGKLSNDTYIGLNVTQASLDGLHSGIIRLEGVPGYRMEVDCKASPPAHLSVTTWSGISVSITHGLPDINDEIEFQSRYPGQITTMTTGLEDNQIYPWLSFFDWDQAYLGTMVMRNWSQWTQPSPYGNITFEASNMMADGFYGDKYIMSAFGLACNVTRETGSVNLTRGSGSIWSRETEIWSGETSPVQMYIADWQLALNYHSPVDIGGMPGLGQPLQDSAWLGDSYYYYEGDTTEVALDFHVNVMNFLYAVGEIERLLHETKNANASLHNGRTDYRQTVQAFDKGQMYRMVYIPVILLVGMLCISVAALITFCLLVTDITRGTASVKTWQQVGTVQLLADSVSGLRYDPVVENMNQAGRSGAEKIAQHCKVRYEAVPGRRNILKAESPAMDKEGQPKKLAFLSRFLN